MDQEEKKGIIIALAAAAGLAAVGFLTARGQAQAAAQRGPTLQPQPGPDQSGTWTPAPGSSAGVYWTPPAGATIREGVLYDQNNTPMYEVSQSTGFLDDYTTGAPVTRNDATGTHRVVLDPAWLQAHLSGSSAA